jgi:hypothetical protein
VSKGPDFITIGAMKCATSTLHYQLALQPGIFMTDLKEPNFFSNDEEYARGMDWYLSLFDDAEAGDLCGESSTHYTKLPTYPNAIARMHAAFPDLKLIYMMRHPVKRLVSHYMHEWSQAVISTDIDSAVAEFPELTKYSLYTEQLKPYFEMYGPDRVLPIFFERWCQNPQAELERVAQFIGYDRPIEWKPELEADNVSSDRMRKNALRDLIVEAPGLRELRRALVPKSFRTWVRGLWTMKQKPTLNADNLRHLEAVFDEDLATLGTWLGIADLSCHTWKDRATAQAYDWVASQVPQPTAVAATTTRDVAKEAG